MGSRPFTDAFARAAVGLAVVDLEGRIELVNPSMAALLGRAPRELAEMRLFDVVHPDDVPVLAARLELATNTGRRVCPALLRRRDTTRGGSRRLRVVVDPMVEDPGITGFIVTVEDVTDLLSTERRFEALLERSDERIFLLGADWTILYASAAERRELGARLRTTFPLDRFDASDATRLRDLFAATLVHAGARPPVTVRVRGDDGHWRMREVVMTNLLHDPAVAGIVVNSRDVTPPSAERDERQTDGMDRRVLGLAGLPTFSGDEQSRPREWIVVIEAEAGMNDMLSDLGSFRAILRSLEDAGATGIHTPERYALQLSVVERDVGTALVRATDRWRNVARPLTPTGWSLVRAEVLTREELERELNAGE